MKRIITNTLYFIAIATTLSSCVSNQSKQKTEEEKIVETVGSNGEMMDEFAKSKLIFYSS